MFRAPRTSFNDFVPIAGAVLMLLSVPVFSRRPVRAVMAEMLALLGVIAAGELLWLAPALVGRLRGLDPRFSTWARTIGRRSKPSARRVLSGLYFYPLLAIASAAVIGVKLVGHVFPFHG